MTTPRWLQNRIANSLKDVTRIRRELRKAGRLKDAMRLERDLKRAQIECGYAQHWVMLTQEDRPSRRAESRSHYDTVTNFARPSNVVREIEDVEGRLPDRDMARAPQNNWPRTNRSGI